MKNSRQKVIVLVGGIVVLFLSGCNVYHTGAANIDQALESENRVKVETTDNRIYEFKELRRENGQLFGITRWNSETSQYMFDRVQLMEGKKGKNVKIPLTEEEVRAVYLKNRKASRWVNYGVPLVGAAGLIGITSPNFRPDVGN